MHITIIDILIVFLAIGALLRGYQIGFLRQGISTVMFIVGLFPGSWLSGYAMEHVSGPSKPLAGLAVLLTVCFLLMTIGEIIAVRLKHAVENKLIHKLDNGLGSFMSVITLLLGFWLAGALFNLAPPSGLQTALKQSVIISAFTSRLPPAGQVLTTLNTLIDPNQSPQVFAGREPTPDATYTLPNPQQYTDMLSQAQQSVVKIEGLGCGGIVDGSGFVFAREFVATNAHVVAGVSSPKIQSGNKTYNTIPVAFDAENDIAVLLVPGLAARPMTVNRMNLAPKSPAFALGYPGGGDYSVSPAVVFDQFKALGQDIYGKNRVIREVYSLQTTIVRGNSGGPVVGADGTVIGVVFATSTTYNNVGYALTMEQVHQVLHKAQTNSNPVSTGKCSEK
ncbi:MarP family serine protease [Candidatus Saccharibacteria bacterium]|nr:MAG: MarP family serine protease [Candidatus Saccharibacteria bacterium]